MSYKYSWFFNGTATANNYSRGNTTKVTEARFWRDGVNELVKAELKLANASESDSNLKIFSSDGGDNRNKVYLYVGVNGTNADALKFLFKFNPNQPPKFGSDGYCTVKLTQWCGDGTSGRQLDEVGFDSGEVKTYTGGISEVLDYGVGGFIINGEGSSDEIDAINVASATDRVGLSFKPHASMSKWDAIKKFSKDNDYEINLVES